MWKPGAAGHDENLPSEGRYGPGGSTEGDYFILRELEQSSATQSFVADVATR
jgi:hypothetical protein